MHFKIILSKMPPVPSLLKNPPCLPSTFRIKSCPRLTSGFPKLAPIHSLHCQISLLPSTPSTTTWLVIARTHNKSSLPSNALPTLECRCACPALTKGVPRRSLECRSGTRLCSSLALLCDLQKVNFSVPQLPQQ